MSTTLTRLTFLTIMEAAAAALAPLEDGDPTVTTGPVDAVSPPTLILESAEPWLDPVAITGAGRTMGPCAYTYGLTVHAIAGRVEPETGFADLAILVDYAIGCLLADADQWPLATVGRAGQIQIGGVWYLGAPITFRVPVSLDTA